MFSFEAEKARTGIDILLREGLISTEHHNRLNGLIEKSAQEDREYRKYWDTAEELYQLKHPGGDFSVLTKERQMPYINMVKKIREADL